MKLRLTEAALADLRSIRAHTLETWGSDQEQRYLDRIWSRLEDLQQNPGRYRLRPDLFPGCRIAAEGKHVILFRANETESSKSPASSTRQWTLNATFLPIVRNDWGLALTTTTLLPLPKIPL
jgi:plasmid stabilization system protein ParE